jgi:hypothetical protein
VKPFGPAFYYSVPVERKFENVFPATNKLYPLVNRDGYGSGFGYAQQAMHAGVPVGYYVGDEALDSVKPENYPTAWLTSNTDSMPAEELAKLNSIAPVHDLAKVKDWTTIPSPIKFSAGACGFAFQDQHDESIILIWRQGRGPDGKDESVAGNTSMSCTVNFSTIKDGTYSVEDLFDNTIKYPVTIENGSGSFNFTLERWDCRAFKSTMLSPNTGITGTRIRPKMNSRIHSTDHNGTITHLYTLQGRIIGTRETLGSSIALGRRIIIEKPDGVTCARIRTAVTRIK